MYDSDSLLARPFNIFAVFLTLALLIGGLFPYPELSEEIVLFIGRFHPLVVHMPIGFISAVFLLQLVSLFTQSDLRLGIGTLLWFTMITAILSAVIGTLLAIPGGYDEQLLQQHRWLGTGTCIVCVWMLSAHRSMRPGSGLLYSLFLLVCMGLVGATGHWGGSLTHGEDYLTAYLPEALGGKGRAQPVEAGTREDAAVFGRVIQPILDSKCVSCHSPAKNNGELRLHDLESVWAGGKHGSAIATNNAADSLLIQRALLPLEHKEHMPPKGKVQLSDAELELFSWWIDQGAPERMPLEDDLPADEAVALLETALGFVVADPRLPMLPWEDVVLTSTALHDNPQVRIRRVALDSPALDVFFEPSTNTVDDLVAKLAPVKANITLLDMGNTRFTEAALEQIGTFSNLEELRLHNTPITDAGLPYLENLRQLKEINLYGTPISDAALQILKKLPKLRQVITWDTEVSYAAAEAFVAEMVNVNKQRKLQHEINELESQLKSMEVEVVGAKKAEGGPPTHSAELFNKEAEKYGALVSPRARVTVSSTTPFDPPGGLQKLVLEAAYSQPFAFQTQAEKNPWVRFGFDQAVILNAISIMNRRDAADQSAGLVLESSNRSSADGTLNLTQTADNTLTEYDLGKRLSGRYVVMRLTGTGTCNPGGTELVFGYAGSGSGYRNRVLDLDPVAYYTFDTADLIDADTVGNLGSLSNTATLSGGAAFTGLSGGFSGGGLHIDDDSSQMLLVDGGAIDLNNDWTISVWFQGLHDTAGWRTLTRSEGDGQDHQVIVQDGTNDLGLFNNDPAGDTLAVGFRDSGCDLLPGDTAWHHLVAVGTGGDAGQTDFYIDGILVGTADQGSSGNIYAIGNFQNGGQPFARTIDEFAVFNTALTAGEIASLARLDTGPAEVRETVILPDPVRATASSEFSEQYAVGHLYDGTVTLEDVGTTRNQGDQYAGKGIGPHVVVYDMGAQVTFDRIFYAQRPVNDCDRVTAIEFWVTGTDPGAASLSMPVFSGKDWQEVWKFEGVKPEWHVDLTGIALQKRQAKNFRLTIPKDAATLHLQKVLLWADQPEPMVSIAALEGDKAKYGEPITTRARVTVSSTSPYDTPDGLEALVQDKDNGRAFAFHTQNEDHPWVQFSYDQAITLNGLSIRNRDDAPERAEGLSLESSQNGKDWREVWTPARVEPAWHVDLTGVPAEKRKAPHFRLIIKQTATLNLGQVRMWAKKEAPGVSPALFTKEKEKYGALISKHARVTVSSTSQYDPPDGLKALIQDEDNELPFAFHTENEAHPWVQFSYDQAISLNAISIRNRGNILERADGLALESSPNGTDWQEIWRSPGIEAAWNVDLTAIPVAKRQVQHFRLIIAKEGDAMLHLGQVRLWGQGLTPEAAPPAKAAPPPKTEPAAEAAPVVPPGIRKEEAAGRITP